jgi:hypothetical protein
MAYSPLWRRYPKTEEIEFGRGKAEGGMGKAENWWMQKYHLNRLPMVGTIAAEPSPAPD